MNISFKKLSDLKEVAVRRAHKECIDYDFLLDSENMPWGEFLRKTDAESKGLNLPDDRVRCDFFVLVDEDENVIGRTSIRHDLNDFLFNEGGHIGYAVLPKFRRKGYATEILNMSLEFIKNIGVKKVLITVSEKNIGSRKVAESCGGIYENSMPSTVVEGDMVRRYWIET